MIDFIKNNNKGSALILSIIVGTILFAISMSFVSILEKEIRRQSFTERSQVAFNIANSSIECVLYNDFRRHIFDPLFDVGSRRSLNCGPFFNVVEKNNWNNEYEVVLKTYAGERARVGRFFEFSIIMSGTGMFREGEYPCADVIIHKVCPTGEQYTSCSSSIENTIEVRGYDSCVFIDENTTETGDVVRLLRLFY